MNLKQRDPQWQQFYASWGEELIAQLNRVNNLIGDAHRPSEGSWREILLRGLLRRVLPSHLRVSTGFILGWPERTASPQADVLVWDTRRQAAFMEVGEFAIVSDSTARAIVEVKTTLNRTNLTAALANLHPGHYLYWHNANERPRSKAQPIVDVAVKPPVRAVLGYHSGWGKSERAVLGVYRTLDAFYREFYGEDLTEWLSHFNYPKQSNLVDIVAVDGVVVEPGTISTFDRDGQFEPATPNIRAGFGARIFEGEAEFAWLARFVLKIAEHLRALEEHYTRLGETGPLLHVAGRPSKVGTLSFGTPVGERYGFNAVAGLTPESETKLYERRTAGRRARQRREDDRAEPNSRTP